MPEPWLESASAPLSDEVISRQEQALEAIARFERVRSKRDAAHNPVVHGVLVVATAIRKHEATVLETRAEAATDEHFGMVARLEQLTAENPAQAQPE